MSDSQPVDYVMCGLMNALYAKNTNQSTHVLTLPEVTAVFEKHYKIPISIPQLDLAVRGLEHLGVVRLVVDPYADTVIETSDAELFACSEAQRGVLKRGWENEDWLRSALKNPKLWSDLDRGVDLVLSSEPIPSADGFVTIEHNSSAYIEAEAAVADADDIIRSDNEFALEERSWIRSHLEAGLGLIRRGGPVLKSAIISLIIEPLKAALKAAANDRAKSLISLALAALRAWFGH